jgi:ligand-binding SRPBCC domain-containing protein
VVHAGAQLDFQVITFGQIVRSVHEIEEFERPHRMVERQISGPMKLWLHRHEYQSTPEGVLKRDIVEFQLPGGLLGMLLSDAKVCNHLEDGFYYREQRLNDLIAQGVLG